MASSSASSLVIKVKYEETLRRFNALVKGDQNLELNMEEFRAKVCSLFNFPLDANFTLTYIDEDGDQVTLADNEDLHDVVKQGLNPVRITVHMNASKGALPSTPHSGNSTPSKSAAQTFPECIYPKVAEVMNKVPEPLRDTVSKLSAELASKANPAIADIANNLTKLVLQSVLNEPHPRRDTATATNNVNEVPANPKFTSEAKVSEVPVNPKFTSEASVNVGGATKSTQAPKVAEMAKVTEPLGSPSIPSFTSQKVKDACSRLTAGKSASYKESDFILKPRLSGENDKKHKTAEHPSAKYELKRMHDILKVQSEMYGDSYLNNRGLKLAGTSYPSTFDSPRPALTRFPGVLPPPRHDEGLHVPQFQSFNGSFYVPDGAGPIFHRGVRCDGCGVLPITGPRFKSKVKFNYDLCNICFSQMGNEVDYTTIEFPLPNRRPFKGLGDPHASMMRPYGMNYVRPRLDSRFIMDVNVMDGTVMAPSTPFTKIWRMRNNGTLPWSRGLQLIWIGGDRFSAFDSVEIEIPVGGVHIGNEIDVAVDFIAPELPGRYISYWRMTESSGHKFGQRVWVLVQVDGSLKDSACESSLSLNLNLPPESAADPNLALEAEKSPIADDIKHKIEIGDLNFPINDDLLVGNDVASSSSSPVLVDNPTSPVPSLVSLSEVNADVQPPSAPPSNLYPDLSTNSLDDEDEEKNQEQSIGENVEVEEILLKELEQMGFKQVDLNKEVLRGNEYDLERSVDELCSVSEWDPILEELQEMGFQDKAMNKKLLEKNNGSIMRVVMDLISGEQA